MCSHDRLGDAFLLGCLSQTKDNLATHSAESFFFILFSIHPIWPDGYLDLGIFLRPGVPFSVDATDLPGLLV